MVYTPEPPIVMSTSDTKSLVHAYEDSMSCGVAVGERIRVFELITLPMSSVIAVVRQATVFVCGAANAALSGR
jgi:hypothetical protein